MKILLLFLIFLVAFCIFVPFMNIFACFEDSYKYPERSPFASDYEYALTKKKVKHRACTFATIASVVAVAAAIFWFFKTQDTLSIVLTILEIIALIINAVLYNTTKYDNI